MALGSSTQAAELSTGLAGRYRIERELGRGGMAMVYLARDLRHDREVALKVLRPELAASIGAGRFLAEIRLTAQLQHPHIVPLFDSGESGGYLFYVMPYLAGESLRARLDREERLEAEAALAVARPVAQALAYAHELGIVHRDIKPENILLCRGEVFVTDFGIARAVSDAGGERLTATGLALGTPAYMSPEQVLGEPEVDARSDVYSLGCVIYEMLTGAPPFRAATAQAALGQRLAGPPPALPEVPAAVNDLLRRALATRPEERFATARLLAHALPPAGRQRPPAEQSIVVLPFANLSPDPENAYFADGLTEELIADLSKIRALRVISRTSAMLYRDSKKSTPAIAQELNVRYVLEGSVRRAGKELRITAQLIDGATDAHLWAEKYTGVLEDVFELQERLSRRIVEGLSVTLTPEEDRRLAQRPSSDPRAHEVWLRVMHEARSFTPAGVERALQLGTRALATIGDDPLIHAALAFAYYAAYDYWISHDEPTLARAQAAAERALELAPELSHAHLSMALVCYKRGAPAAFARHARRAVELERTADALSWWSLARVEAGQHARAAATADEAMARDPVSFWPVMIRAVADLVGSRAEQAYARVTAAVERSFRDEPFAVWWQGQTAAFAAHDDEARALLEQVGRMGQSVFGGWAAVLRHALDADRATVLAAIDAGGLRGVAGSDEYIPFYLACCLTLIGEHDEALDWIEHAISWGLCAHHLYETNRLLLPLRGEPRFELLMQRAREAERSFGA